MSKISEKEVERAEIELWTHLDLTGHTRSGVKRAVRAALEAAARVREEANAGGGEVDRLKRAVWRLSGSGMSYVRFWEVYSDKLDGLTKTDVRRNEAHPAPSEHALEGGE